MPAARVGRGATVRYRFVGGKGGVGKTTCAAALAIASAAHGARTLLLSTDPAPSLGDALGVRLGRRPRRVPIRRGVLHAAEVDAAAVTREWLATRSRALGEIALRGTWLDAEDVSALLDLSLPGIDELAGLLELTRLGRSGRYDVIVVDTAPTGHTLRMLAMPATLGRIAAVFDGMQDKHRAIVAALRGRWTADAADAFVDGLATEATELAALVRNPRRTGVTWVSLAEPLAVAETLDALGTLARERIPLELLILNRLTPPDRTGCRFCSAMRRVQEAAHASLLSRLPDTLARELPVATVLDRVREPTGVAALTALSRELARVRSGRPRRAAAAKAVVRGVAPVAPAPLCLPESAELRLLLVGGKGGVGKTTCAAALALTLAGSAPSRRVLLLSTDPAHSLADLLGGPVSNVPARLPGGPANLEVRELDADLAYQRARREYATAIDDLFDRAGGPGVDAAHDRRVMHGLVDLAPPGLDEVVAVLEVTALIGAGGKAASWDIIVIDTAPTGHALRLLEMPGLIHEWTQALMRIVLKYQPAFGAGPLAELLLTWSRRIGALRRLLADRRAAQFVVVTRGAALPRAETVRVVRALSALAIDVPAVVVNAVGRGTCAACRRAARAEGREIASLVDALHGRTAPDVALAPAVVPAPAGIAALTHWSTQWLALGGEEPGAAPKRATRRAISSRRAP